MTISSPTLNRQGTLPAAAPESDELVTDQLPGSYSYSDINDADFEQMMDHAHAVNRSKTEALR